MPAASRAGAASYSPDAVATLAPADPAEARSFDELCPQDRRDDIAPEDEPQAQPKRAEHGEADEPCACESDQSTDSAPLEDEDSDDDGRARSEAEKARAQVPLESPTILQTLLAGLCDPLPLLAPPTLASAATTAAGSAENAGQTPVPLATPGENATTPLPIIGDGEARPASRAPRAPSTTGSATADGATPSAPAARSRAGTGSSHDTKPSASAADTAEGALVSAATGRRARIDTAEDTSAQSATGRPSVPKNHAEKSAGLESASGVVRNASIQNKFLPTDDQVVVGDVRAAGTRSAIPAATMSSSTATTAHRFGQGSVLHADTPASAGQPAWTEGLSVDWKGWTNGGGERASTAAQFSQLGEKLNTPAVAATPAAPAPARAAVPAAPGSAPATTSTPVDTAEALAPIHSAIERLVLHGRDQLALTVRFEQGGSLSIKLAMKEGEISTQIQTDVPGLEAALKASWTDLAQDWNSRGWKLGNPEITSSTASYHQRQDNLADGRGSGRDDRRMPDDVPDFGGRSLTPARLKHPAPVTLSGLDAIRAAALARRGIHTWA